LDIELNNDYIKAEDERGVKIIIPIPKDLEPAKKVISLRSQFEKLGNSIFYLGDFKQNDFTKFIPLSMLSNLRREITKKIIVLGKTTYKFDYRRKENINAQYISNSVDYRDNISNSLSEKVYLEHGVSSIQPALEVSKNMVGKKVIMTTRHCILREMGKCLRTTPDSKRNFRLPLRLESGNNVFSLRFDCENCQMEVLRGQS
ncbi:MAG: DUF3656 domain-containing protein, partial [Muribaculaceae bacterium]|nr:DUF3656 domain-containing protein [Muribaculaceae bacterium]